MKAGPRLWLTQPSHEIQLPCSFVPSLEGLGCRKRDKALATRQFLQDSASLGMSMSQQRSCSHCTNVISALEQQRDEPIAVGRLRWQGVDHIALSNRRRPGNVRVRSGGNASDELVSNSLILDVVDVVDGPLASRARSCPSGGR